MGLLWTFWFSSTAFILQYSNFPAAVATEPYTVHPIGVQSDLNVTALYGQDVVLPCTINRTRAGDITVVWMDKHDNVLYYNDARIIDDQRFVLVNEFYPDNWSLRILSVNSQYEGRYRCVANTSPIMIKYFQLSVFVPPRIDTLTSSQDLEVTEGSGVILACNATGYPKPTVRWTVRPGNKHENLPARRLSDIGEVVTVHNVSRYMDVVYTCSADNGYGSPDSHDIRITVRFPTQITKLESKIRRMRGETVTFGCHSEGYPAPLMYFAKDNTQMIGDDEKYSYSSEIPSNEYSTKLFFTINDLQSEDFGYYKCVSINTLGQVSRFVELIDVTPITTSGITTPHSAMEHTIWNYNAKTTVKMVSNNSTSRPKSPGGQGNKPNSRVIKLPSSRGTDDDSAAAYISVTTSLLLASLFL